jgi:hypothetical protein
MKRLIPRLTSLFITFLLGLLLTALFYSKNTIQIEPVLPQPVVLESKPLNNRATLSLCELAANTSAYRGTEVVIEASHIGLLSSQRVVILSECGPETSISASITLAKGSRLHKRLFFQLSDLMSRRSESFAAAADKVIIEGVVQSHNSSLEDLDIVADEVGIRFVP